ncbi:hypothetical protein QEZ54_08735 [Catellatospora sp. KI3]|uniref:hypothetical protein n=1 Tax=Catellatospora sp. KI3 TaxID=3041620 RepID=UPI002482A52B|nr:hypothetical protein [Catellatospora sp. KI3]MDI1461048.1 hypothetical protein [Catellatospora sp. KI3]
MQASDPAGRYDGWWNSEIGGCGSNIRVGPVKSIYDSRGVYYGWMEQRWGNSGNCWGYQWVKVHITKTLPIDSYSGGSPGALTLNINNSQARPYRSADWVTYRSAMAVGTYNSKVLYAPHDQLQGVVSVRPCVGDGLCGNGSATLLFVAWMA